MTLIKRTRITVRRFFRRTEGMSAVEGAIIIPILLLVVCGIMDFGNLFLNLNMVNEAAREGARYVAVSSSSTSVTQSALQTYLRSMYNNTTLTVTMNPNPPSPNSNLTVTVKEPVTILTPLMSVFFKSNPVTVTGSCSMTTEFAS